MFIKKIALCKVAQSKRKITKKERSRNIKEKIITKKKRANKEQ